eukprot:m.311182 g.311182  ORF g.311182 m.311182 type:complete len:936 (+) comp19651_c0_seq1:209-3016(+)
MAAVRCVVALLAIVALFQTAAASRVLLYAGNTLDPTQSSTWSGDVPTSAAAVKPDGWVMAFPEASPGYVEFDGGEYRVGNKWVIENVKVAINNEPKIIFGDQAPASSSGANTLVVTPAAADCASNYKEVGANVNMAAAAEAAVGSSYQPGNAANDALVMSSLIEDDVVLDFLNKPVRVALNDDFINLGSIRNMACAPAVTLTSCSQFNTFSPRVQKCLRAQFLDLCDAVNHPDPTAASSGRPAPSSLATHAGKWWFRAEPADASVTDPALQVSNCIAANAVDDSGDCWPTSSCMNGVQSRVLIDEKEDAAKRIADRQTAILNSWNYMSVTGVVLTPARAGLTCVSAVESQLNTTFWANVGGTTSLVDVTITPGATAVDDSTADITVYAPGTFWYDSYLDVPEVAAASGHPYLQDGAFAKYKVVAASTSDSDEMQLANRIIDVVEPALLQCDVEQAKLDVDQAETDVGDARDQCEASGQCTDCDQAAAVDAIGRLPAAAISAMADAVAAAGPFPSDSAACGPDDGSTAYDDCVTDVAIVRAAAGSCAGDVINKEVELDDKKAVKDEALTKVPQLWWNTLPDNNALVVGSHLTTSERLSLGQWNSHVPQDPLKLSFEQGAVNEFGVARLFLRDQPVPRRRNRRNTALPDTVLVFNYSLLCNPDDTDCQSGNVDAATLAAWQARANTVINGLSGTLQPSMCRTSLGSDDVDAQCAADAIKAKCGTGNLTDPCVVDAKIDYIKCSPALYRDAATHDCFAEVADSTASEAAIDLLLAPANNPGGQGGTGGSTSGGGGGSTIPIAAAAGGCVLLIVLAIIAVKRGWIGKTRSGAKAATNPTERNIVAFENPMYDEPTKGHGSMFADHGSEGLYDEPSFSTANKSNPLYQSAEGLDQPTYDNDFGDSEAGYLAADPASETGYLDTQPQEADEGGYLDVAPDE